MLGFVVTVLLSWLSAGVIGSLIGVFWVTLVALAGILVTGAVGVSVRLSPEQDPAQLSPVEEDVALANRSRHLRSIPVDRPSLHRDRSQDAASRRGA